MYCTQIPVRRGDAQMTRACLPMFYADALSDSVSWYYRCQSMPACYTPPDPTTVLFARNQELRKHMKSVINSDPRLKEMNEIRTELELRLLAAEVSHAQMKREAPGESEGDVEQGHERERCLKSGPPKSTNEPCTAR